MRCLPTYKTCFQPWRFSGRFPMLCMMFTKVICNFSISHTNSSINLLCFVLFCYIYTVLFFLFFLLQIGNNETYSLKARKICTTILLVFSRGLVKFRSHCPGILSLYRDRIDDRFQLTLPGQYIGGQQQNVMLNTWRERAGVCFRAGRKVLSYCHFPFLAKRISAA